MPNQTVRILKKKTTEKELNVVNHAQNI